MASCNSCFDRHDYMYVTAGVNLWKQGCSSLYRLWMYVKREVQSNTLVWFDPVSVDDELQLLFWQTRQLVYDWSCLSVETGCSSLHELWMSVKSEVQTNILWLDQVSVDGELQLLFWQARLHVYDKLFVCGNRVAAHYTDCCLLRVRCKPILCDLIRCL